MTSKSIVFTAPCTAEVQYMELGPVEPGKVRVKTEYTVVSGGTERACLTFYKKFPAYLGYCGVGHVTEVGEGVESVKPGDRVLIYHGKHTAYNTVPENNVTLVTDDSIDSLDAVFVIMASMGLGGVHHLLLEVGESAMVVGLGLLGVFAVQFARLSGAYPVIAADPNPERRALALKLGADHALDPLEADFPEKVKALTHGKGVNACVEVTGAAAALKEALACMALRGRISLLGCTRKSDCQIDYYNEVHRPGITLIGAHNFLPRRKLESAPGNWTHQDDCRAILDLTAAGRVQMRPVLARVVKPDEAPEIYRQLCEDKDFPLGTVFDWRDEK